MHLFDICWALSAGLCPDPTGGFYSASSAGFKGPFKGEEGNRREGKERYERERRDRKGRERRRYYAVLRIPIK